ncbi:MAG: hypothetical protein Q7T97_01330 [Burkholderiaceae bacterium]|nr:hypothetical protein [Burkholderiaceae bacterium]
MTTPDVQTLIGAVRRHLWGGQLFAAVRWALWGTAGWMLLAVVMHLAARPMPVGAVLIALAVLWASMVARAGWKRPADAACALWADRHLGGASAFTTLLELDQARPPRAVPAQAVQHLEAFATAKVPQCLSLLAERRNPMHLSRSLASALVCTGLATLVGLMLPGTTAVPHQQGAVSAASGVVDRAPPDADSPDSAALVSEIASALRASPSDAASPERHGAGNVPAPGSGKTDDDSGSSMAEADALSQGPRGPASGASSGASVDAPPMAGSTSLPGTGSGRHAGDSRDEAAGGGASRALRGTIPVQRFELAVRRPSADRRADPTQVASFDEEPPRRSTAEKQVEGDPAAATPPVAAPDSWLTSTETTYVQAWLKASARQR